MWFVNSRELVDAVLLLLHGYQDVVGVGSSGVSGLKTSFHQIRMKPEDVEKKAFNTNYGQLEYLVMPMGLGDAAAIFPTLMNSILHDPIDDFDVASIDDQEISSKNERSHYRHLEFIVDRL